MTPALDAQLMLRIRSGDQDAFKVLYQAMFAPLVVYVAQLLGSRDGAADVVQDVFASLWRKRSELAVHESVKSYLYAACRNAARDVMRSEEARTRRVERYVGESTGDGAGENGDATEEMVRAVWNAVGSLSPRAREVFVLSRQRSMTRQQIAEHLGISIKTVEMHLTRALAALRTALRDLPR